MVIFSTLVHRLFIWLIHFKLKNDHDTFSVSSFDAIVKVLLESQDLIPASKAAFEKLADRVKTKLAELEKGFPASISEVKALSKKLESKGLLPANVYLFLKGHTVLTNVVLSFLRPICEALHLEKLELIKSSAISAQQKNELLSKQKSARLSIDKLIHANTEFKSCFLYSKIKADFDGYFRDFNSDLHTR
ncbi:MAG: hypothetical protein RLZZ519_1101 [Bacteroidota bacterium]|jgi:hypothetical protein